MRVRVPPPAPNFLGATMANERPNAGFGRMSAQLTGVSRCPHCGIANPQLPRQWGSDGIIPPGNGTAGSRWCVHACTTCGGLILAKGLPGDTHTNAVIVAIIPDIKSAAAELPDVAKNFLQQAYETLHAPDAAAVMAGSAVDAMLKSRGYKDGNLYSRIDQAVADHVLTEAMGRWAHEVRLGANRPRHADAESPHLSPDEARQSVEFAEALGMFMFVLTSRIEKGIEMAQKAGR